MLLSLVLLLLQAPSPDEIRRLADRVTDYPSKFALAKIGAPALPALFEKLSSNDDTVVFEAKSAARWIVAYASNRADMAECLRPFVDAERPPAVRHFAVELLGDNGEAASVRVLGQLLRDETVREVAVGSLRRITDRSAGAALVRSITSVPPDFRRAILLAIGDRRDAHLTPALVEAAGFPATRDAALEALGRCGDPSAVPMLLEAAKGESEIAVQGLLAHEEGDLAFEFLRTDEQRRAALACCRKRETAEKGIARAETREAGLGALLRLAGESPAGNEEAFLRVLASSKNRGHLARALSCLAAAKSGRIDAIAPFLSHDGPLVRAAAVAALRAHPSPKATAALLAAKPTPAVVAALGERGDPAALPALLSLAKEGGDAEIRAAAVKALGSIGDATTVGAVEEAARAGTPGAVDAIVAIAERSRDAALFARALELGAGDRAIAGLGAVGGPSDSPRIEACVEKHREAALAALVAIADRAPEEEKTRLYLRAAELGASGLEERLRERGERIEFPSVEGRVAYWWVLGTYDAPDEASWSRAEAPERAIDLRAGDGDRRWNPCAGTGEDAVVDLDRFFKDKNDRVFAYATAEVVLRRERSGYLLCGSDDGIVVWVNGVKVHEALAPRGFEAAQDRVPVQWKEGANTVLVKVTEAGGGWQFAVRLTDEENRPLRFRVR